jgi:hypothetical protein
MRRHAPVLTARLVQLISEFFKVERKRIRGLAFVQKMLKTTQMTIIVNVRRKISAEHGMVPVVFFVSVAVKTSKGSLVNKIVRRFNVAIIHVSGRQIGRFFQFSEPRRRGSEKV